VIHPLHLVPRTRDRENPSARERAASTSASGPASPPDAVGAASSHAGDRDRRARAGKRRTSDRQGRGSSSSASTTEPPPCVLTKAIVKESGSRDALGPHRAPRVSHAQRAKRAVQSRARDRLAVVVTCPSGASAWERALRCRASATAHAALDILRWLIDGATRGRSSRRKAEARAAPPPRRRSACVIPRSVPRDFAPS
jgi:hypothetical protein